MSVKIAPSLLAADFSRLGEEVKAVGNAGADLLHLDIMDGHFVPNLSFGSAVVKAMRPLSKLPFDVHLMVAPVDLHIDPFVKAGADIITFHPEASPNVEETLTKIRSKGVKVGLAVNPETPLSLIEPHLEQGILDLILVMTVQPGFGGQAFMDTQLSKVESLRNHIDKSSQAVALSVDGGINAETAKKAREAGAHILVAGTSVFKGDHKTYKGNIDALRAS